jgi:hypothetical protein
VLVAADVRVALGVGLVDVGAAVQAARKRRPQRIMVHLTLLWYANIGYPF